MEKGDGHELFFKTNYKGGNFVMIIQNESPIDYYFTKGNNNEIWYGPHDQKFVSELWMTNQNNVKIFVPVYNYSASHVLETLRDGELFLSKPSAMNDPFEGLFESPPSQLMSPSEMQKIADRNISFRSFTKFRSEPVEQEILLWSHYADKHKGIRIGFMWEIIDFDDSQRRGQGDYYYLEPMCYKKEREKILPVLQRSSPEAMRECVLNVYKTKGTVWEYEEEIRLFTIPDTTLQNKKQYLLCNIRNRLQSLRKLYERDSSAISNNTQEFQYLFHDAIQLIDIETHVSNFRNKFVARENMQFMRFEPQTIFSVDYGYRYPNDEKSKYLKEQIDNVIQTKYPHVVVRKANIKDKGYELQYETISGKMPEIKKLVPKNN
jgi:hypothetical protein